MRRPHSIVLNGTCLETRDAKVENTEQEFTRFLPLIQKSHSAPILSNFNPTHLHDPELIERLTKVIEDSQSQSCIDVDPALLSTSDEQTRVDSSPILSVQQARSFHGREWVFDKILRYLRGTSKHKSITEPSELLSEFDTITDSYASRCVEHDNDGTTTDKLRTNSPCQISIMGGPGSGKTTVCLRIFEYHLAHNTLATARELSLCARVASHILAVHFCSPQFRISFDPVKFVISIHQQILRSVSPVVQFYRELFEPDSIHTKWLQPDVIRQSPSQAFHCGILDALHNCENRWTSHNKRNSLPLMILIDGMDEVLSYDARTNTNSHNPPEGSILKLIMDTIENFPKWLGLLITTRRQNRALINHIFPAGRRIHLDDLHRSAVGHDIQQYLLSRLAAEHKLQHAFHAHMHSDVMSCLRIKSSACILYLETILDAIADSRIYPDQLSTIPGTLNGLYLWFCQSMFPADSSTFEFIRSLFEILLASDFTLNESDLFTLMNHNFPQLSFQDFRAHLLTTRGLLINVAVDEDAPYCGPIQMNPTSEQNLKIHFFHPSFAEWLSDVKHCTLNYLCDREHGSTLIRTALSSVYALNDQPLVDDHRFSYNGNGYSLDETISQIVVSEIQHLRRESDPLDTSCYYYTNRTTGGIAVSMGSGNIDVNVQANGRYDSILLAARKGELNEVEQLIDSGANVDEVDLDGWSVLRTAAWRGHLEIVQLLIKHGASVNLAGPDGRSALRAAAWAGHEEIVAKLLESGAYVDIGDAEGRTPLIAAAYMGHVGVVELLSQAGANLNHADEDGRTAMHVAAFCVRPSDTHHKVVSTLLDHGANPDLVDSEGLTPLLGAAQIGNRDVCELCLEADSDVNQLDRLGNSALMLAVMGGHTNVVRLLLFWGATVDMLDTSGRSLLSLAAAIGSATIVQELLARGLDDAHRDNAGCTPLHMAAAGPQSALTVNCEIETGQEQYENVIRLLIDSGVRVDDVDNIGRTPLFVACEANQLGAVKLLLNTSPTNSFNTDDGNPPTLHHTGTEVSMDSVEGNSSSQIRVFVNQPAMDQQTPLRVAALANNPDMVAVLLAAGADPDYQDAYGRTILYLLAIEGILDMSDLLLHTPAPGAHLRPGSVAVVGANPVLADDEGRCPLHVATWQGHLPLVRLLLQAGTPVDIRDREGRTPLQLAAWQGHATCCQVLLNEGHARVDAVCSQGATSLCIAAQEGHLNVCTVLLKAGANPFQADGHGRTPLRVAQKAGHVGICHLIQRYRPANHHALAHSPQFVSSSQADEQQLQSQPLRRNQVSVKQPTHALHNPQQPRSHNSQRFPAEHATVLSVPTTSEPNPGRVYLDDENPYARPPGPLAASCNQPSSVLPAGLEKHQFHANATYICPNPNVTADWQGSGAHIPNQHHTDPAYNHGPDAQMPKTHTISESSELCPHTGLGRPSYLAVHNRRTTAPPTIGQWNRCVPLMVTNANSNNRLVTDASRQIFPDLILQHSEVLPQLPPTEQSQRMKANKLTSNHPLSGIVNSINNVVNPTKRNDKTGQTSSGFTANQTDKQLLVDQSADRSTSSRPPSRKSLAKSTLVGILGLGGRRFGRKSHKSHPISPDTPSPTTLRHRLSTPAESNSPILSDHTRPSSEQLRGNPPPPVAGHAKHPNYSDSDTADTLTTRHPTNGHIESLARKLACCSYVGAIPQHNQDSSPNVPSVSLTPSQSATQHHLHANLHSPNR